MIDIHVDIDQAIAEVGRYTGQMPFAIATALNRTGEDGNAALRASIGQHFIVRDDRLLRYVAPTILPRDQRASKTNLSVVLKTEGRGRILDPFEIGLAKTGTLAKPVAIPTATLRPTPRAVVPRRMYPANLGLTPKKTPTGTSYYALGRGSILHHKTPIHHTARGAVQIKGKQRTFVLDPRLHRGIAPEQWGVYQRIGPKRGDIRMLWRYVDQVPRPAILEFEETVRRTVETRWAPNFDGAFAFALRTAR